MNSENILKGWFSSLLGAFLMGLAIYEYFFVEPAITEKEAAVTFVLGYVLFQMRDKLSDWIGQAVTVVLDKFRNKQA